MTIDRRAALGTLALGLVAGLIPRAASAAPGATALAGVHLDTRPIADKGLPVYADRVVRNGLGPVKATLADRLTGGRGAPTLVLSISLLNLASDPSGRGRRGDATGAADWIEGDAILVDAKGREIASKHIVTTCDPSGVEKLGSDSGEDRRIGIACQTFAYWAVRELGL